MKRERLLLIFLVLAYFIFYPKPVDAVEQNAGNKASSQVSIRFLKDNTPIKNGKFPDTMGKFLGDLGIGDGKRLPQTGEILTILGIAFGYLLIVAAGGIIIYRYILGGRTMKLWKSMLVTTVVLGGLVSPTLALADNTAGDKEENKDATSYGTVELKAGDEEEGTPTNPGGEEGGGTGNTGRLALVFVSPLDFGTFQLTGKQETIKAKNTAPNIEVRDIRGTAKGWTVSVSMSDFVQQEDNKVTLKGAELYLPMGEATSPDKLTDGKPTPVEVKSVEKDPQPVFVANDKEGAGIWLNEFGKDKIELKIPQDALVGNYKAELNWTIATTPTGTEEETKGAE
ncbi:hypothetical protein DOK67_0002055 [Enterococcus sp. DIV0212c]|uniref:WxL domain-containing protein n=1 Tax=Enterococcus sp. DIV0212c TaxID=2230867 RepID=UPI001A9AE079|nr:WxL domain-containing protein [Enterococcus sp. DIV0212c]MBO1354768.1 WxL domain-containing protein [Enterococcus sp. DIV0212c]